MVRRCSRFYHEGQISIPYTWWVGEVGSRFLLALCDNKRILGNRCRSCQFGVMYRRGRIAADVLRILKDGWNWVMKCGYSPHHCPISISSSTCQSAFFAYAVIKLDGADVDWFISLGRPNKLRNSVRVKALFKEDRKGHILDIDSFQII